MGKNTGLTVESIPVGSASRDLHSGLEIPGTPLKLLAVTLAMPVASMDPGVLIGSRARTGMQAANIGMVLSFVLYCGSGYTCGAIGPTGYVSTCQAWRISGSICPSSPLRPRPLTRI